MSGSSTNKITIREKIKKSSQEKVRIALENFFSAGNLIHFKNKEQISGSFVVTESPVIHFDNPFSNSKINYIQIKLDGYLFDKMYFARSSAFIPLKIEKIMIYNEADFYWVSNIVFCGKQRDSGSTFTIERNFYHLSANIFSFDGKHVLDLLRPLRQHEL